MSGTTHTVTCQTCNMTFDFEIYDDGWEGIKIDNSNAKCWDCQKRERPQDFYDYQCQRCNEWFNKRDDKGFLIRENLTWICYECAKVVVASVDWSAVKEFVTRLTAGDSQT